MKYLGEDSLSSVLGTILHVAWYVILVGTILCFIAGTGFIIVSSMDINHEAAEMLQTELQKEMQTDEDLRNFINLPIGVKFLMLPYLGVVVFFLLKIVRKARALFENFKKNDVFSTSNVEIITSLSKLVIIFSILSFNIASLITGIVLLILSDIFKNGAMLQEEHDLTI